MVESNNVVGLSMAITWILYFVFILKVALIYSTPKLVNILYDNKGVKLSYSSMVPFC